MTGLVVSQTFQAATGQMNFVVFDGTVPFDPNTSQENFGAGNTIIYDAPSDSFRLKITTGVAQVDATFSPADIQVVPSTKVTLYRNGSITLILAKPGDAGTGLQYVTTGAWSVAPSSTNDRGYLVFGIPTSEGTVPHTGSATFDGTAGGYLISSGKQYGLLGSATIITNFVTGGVRGQFVLNKTDLTTQISSPWHDLNVRANISGNVFEGTVGTADATLTGPLSGGFFGPNAAETGGTWSVNNTLEHAIGTFVGEKK